MSEFKVRVDYSGKKYNFLLIVRHLSAKKVECLCDCGNTTYAEPAQVFLGRKKSCGCRRNELIGKANSRCGGKTRTPEGKIWRAMIDRCTNQENIGYKNYGARGIKVCERWGGPRGMQNFFDDMGPRPSPKHTLDRIDNDGPYAPWNCRWATRLEQAWNKRTSRMVTFNGKTQCLMLWSRELGISNSALSYRLRTGWSIEDAFTLIPNGNPWTSRKIRKNKVSN